MRFLIRSTIALFVLAVILSAGGYLYLRRSLPVTEGEIALPGLGAPVEVLRDRFGGPHVLAQAERAAHFALGFLHAQGRLWQLEMNRRIAAGRLAEGVGRSGVETDRFMRTLGVQRTAEANVPHLDAQTRAHLEAYAAGVNAFLATDPVLPLEFLMLRVRPETWTPAQSVAWLKMMAWDLGGNWRNELLRMRLAKTLPLARIHEFLPPYPGDAPLGIVEP